MYRLTAVVAKTELGYWLLSAIGTSRVEIHFAFTKVKTHETASDDSIKAFRSTMTEVVEQDTWNHDCN
jgi:hypothetical protein